MFCAMLKNDFTGEGNKQGLDNELTMQFLRLAEHHFGLSKEHGASRRQNTCEETSAKWSALLSFAAQLTAVKN